MIDIENDRRVSRLVCHSALLHTQTVGYECVIAFLINNKCICVSTNI